MCQQPDVEAWIPACCGRSIYDTGVIERLHGGIADAHDSESLGRQMIYRFPVAVDLDVSDGIRR